MFDIKKIAIVDDNIFYIDEIERLLKIHISDMPCTIFRFSDSKSFTDSLDEESYDAVFLDIMLDDMTGIEVGRIINEIQPEANIIFVSSEPGYFKDVYKVNHSYFLVKDFELDRFEDAVKKIIRSFQRDVLVFGSKTENYSVKLSEILYLEAYMRHTRIHMTSGAVKEYNLNIREIEENLHSESFVRTHQSFIVNMKYIRKYNRTNITMINGDNVSISRSYCESAREKITMFLGGVI